MQRLKESIMLIIGIVLFLVVRIIGADIPLYDDGGANKLLITNTDDIHMNLVINPHYQLATWFYAFTSILFGYDTFGIHILFVIFAFITLCAIGIFIWRNYHPSIAIFAVFLAAFSYFSFYAAIETDTEGSIIAFFVFLSLYFLYNFLKYAKNIWAILTGLMFGLITITEMHFLLFAAPSILLFYLYKKRIMPALILGVSISLISGLSFLLIPLLIFATQKETWWFFIRELFFFTINNTFTLFPKLLNLWVLFPLFFSLTPLIFGLVFIHIISFRKHRCDMFLYWVLLSGLIVFIGVPFELLVSPKFFVFLWPVLIILCAETIFHFFLNKKELMVIITLAFFLASIFYFYNQFSSDFWFLVDSASYVIKINQRLLIGSSFITLGSLLFYILLRKKILLSRIFLIGFLASGVAFNIFLISEAILDETPKQLLGDFINYTNTHTIKRPLFSWNEDVPFYLGDYGFNPINFYERPAFAEYAKTIGFNEFGYIDLDTPSTVLEPLLQKGGTVFLYNYPSKYVIKQNSLHQKKLELIRRYCKLERNFIYKIADGEIYSCPK